MCFEKFASFWAVHDELPQTADLIALVSFGSTATRLSNGSVAVIHEAKRVAGRYPQARIAFGAFTLSPVPGMEERLKRLYFQDPVFAGSVVSTIEEAEKIRAALPEGFVPRSIVLVTDQWHSRSAKMVWQHIWKDVQPDIRVLTVRSATVIETANPMWALRRHFTWALVNVLRHLFLLCVPGSIWLMKRLNIHQPT